MSAAAGAGGAREEEEAAECVDSNLSEAGEMPEGAMPGEALAWRWVIAPKLIDPVWLTGYISTPPEDGWGPRGDPQLWRDGDDVGKLACRGSETFPVPGAPVLAGAEYAEGGRLHLSRFAKVSGNYKPAPASVLFVGSGTHSWDVMVSGEVSVGVGVAGYNQSDWLGRQYYPRFRKDTSPFCRFATSSSSISGQIEDEKVASYVSGPFWRCTLDRGRELFTVRRLQATEETYSPEMGPTPAEDIEYAAELVEHGAETKDFVYFRVPRDEVPTDLPLLVLCGGNPGSVALLSTSMPSRTKAARKT